MRAEPEFLRLQVVPEPGDQKKPATKTWASTAIVVIVCGGLKTCRTGSSSVSPFRTLHSPATLSILRRLLLLSNQLCGNGRTAYSAITPRKSDHCCSDPLWCGHLE